MRSPTPLDAKYRYQQLPEGSYQNPLSFKTRHLNRDRNSILPDNYIQLRSPHGSCLLWSIFIAGFLNLRHRRDEALETFLTACFGEIIKQENSHTALMTALDSFQNHEHQPFAENMDMMQNLVSNFFRTRLINFMVDEKNQLLAEVKTLYNNDEKKIQQQIEYWKNPKSWLDELHINAAAKMLNLSIIIYKNKTTYEYKSDDDFNTTIHLVLIEKIIEEYILTDDAPVTQHREISHYVPAVAEDRYALFQQHRRAIPTFEIDTINARNHEDDCIDSCLRHCIVL